MEEGGLLIIAYPGGDRFEAFDRPRPLLPALALILRSGRLPSFLVPRSLAPLKPNWTEAKRTLRDRGELQRQQRRRMAISDLTSRLSSRDVGSGSIGMMKKKDISSIHDQSSCTANNLYLDSYRRRRIRGVGGGG